MKTEKLHIKMNGVDITIEANASLTTTTAPNDEDEFMNNRLDDINVYEEEELLGDNDE